MLLHIREKAAYVAKRARHVAICNAAIVPYAKSINAKAILSPSYDTYYHYKGSEAETASYIIALDAINFGSGYFRSLKKDASLTSGYFHIAQCLKRYYETSAPLHPIELSVITPGDCAVLFEQDMANPEIYTLMNLFANAWQELGRFLQMRFSGSFLCLVEQARHSADQLVKILSEMHAFQDEAMYHGVCIPFYKRAQLTVSDLFWAFNGKGLGYFKDIDLLTVFADNRVPHVLYLDGILRYSDTLSHRIAEGEEITAGSEEEVEIRACSIHACELIVQAVRNEEKHFSAAILDYYLWNKGQNCFYKSVPTHQTRSTMFY